MPPLLRLTIATPCTADWNEMAGYEDVRHCTSCDRNVYNAEAMSERELRRLITANEGEVPCLRLHRRPDGTVVTRACFATVERAGAWVRAQTAVAFACLAAFWTGAAQAARISPVSSGNASAGETPSTKKRRPRKKPAPKPAPAPAPPDRRNTTMGKIDINDMVVF